VRAFSHNVARQTVQRLMGFWLMFHLYGGTVAGLLEAGVMTSATAYRQMHEFREVFGMDVREFAPDLAQEVAKAGGRGSNGEEA